MHTHIVLKKVVFRTWNNKHNLLNAYEKIFNHWKIYIYIDIENTKKKEIDSKLFYYRMLLYNWVEMILL